MLINKKIIMYKSFKNYIKKLYNILPNIVKIKVIKIFNINISNVKNSYIKLNSIQIGSLIKKNDNSGKKILFDMLFCQGGFHGGGEYGKAVFYELVKKVAADIDDVVLYIAVNPDLIIEELIVDICKKNPKIIKLVNVKCYNDIVCLINTDIFNVFFTPAIVMYSNGYEYMKTSGREIGFDCKFTKIIGTLHDIRDFEIFSNFLKIYNFRKRLGCKNENSSTKIQKNNEIKKYKKLSEELKFMYKEIVSNKFIDTIITVSNYSKDSIIKNISIHGNKINVLYSCMKKRLFPLKICYNGIDFKNIKYLLAINIGRFEKNGSAAVKAMDELFSYELKLMNYFVVITGISDISELDISDINNPEKFITLGFLSPENLEYLYKHAICLIYISFNEGFGYPPIEAMSYNTPSVVSDNTAIPEICGDAAYYCNPYDLDSIKEAIISCLSNQPNFDILHERYKYISNKQNEDLNELVVNIIEKAKLGVY